jgi:hypothetical protein
MYSATSSVASTLPSTVANRLVGSSVQSNFRTHPYDAASCSGAKRTEDELIQPNNPGTGINGVGRSTSLMTGSRSRPKPLVLRKSLSGPCCLPSDGTSARCQSTHKNQLPTVRDGCKSFKRSTSGSLESGCCSTGDKLGHSQRSRNGGFSRRCLSDCKQQTVLASGRRQNRRLPKLTNICKNEVCERGWDELADGIALDLDEADCGDGESDVPVKSETDLGTTREPTPADDIAEAEADNLRSQTIVARSVDACGNTLWTVYESSSSQQQQQQLSGCQMKRGRSGFYRARLNSMMERQKSFRISAAGYDSRYDDIVHNGLPELRLHHGVYDEHNDDDDDDEGDAICCSRLQPKLTTASSIQPRNAIEKCRVWLQMQKTDEGGERVAKRRRNTTPGGVLRRRPQRSLPRLQLKPKSIARKQTD